MGESQKVKEIIEGNKEEYNFIIQKYKDILYAVSIRFVESQEQAESIVETCFIHIYNHLKAYDRESELFSDWFYTITIPFLQEKLMGFALNKNVCDYMTLHQPSAIKVEAAIVSLPESLRFDFLVFHLVDLEYMKLASFLNVNKFDFEKSLQAANDLVRKKTLELEDQVNHSECFALDEIIHYLNGECAEHEKNAIVDHLEFCPSCREVINKIHNEKKTIENIIRAPHLDDDFNKKMIDKLQVYEKKMPKQRTWKYQLGVIGIIVGLMTLGGILLPKLVPYTKMVTNYINHGAFYNVWAEGTYTAIDKDVTVEITGVQVDPLHIVVYYETHTESQTNELELVDFFTATIVDEEGTHYPSMVSAPLVENFYYDEEKEVEGSGSEDVNRTAFMVKAINEETLPSEFTIRFQFQRVKGHGGRWEIEVPIQYDKAVEQVEIVEFNEVMVIDDKIEVEILSMEYGKYGSRLSYDIRLKEEAIKRIETKLAQSDQTYNPPYSNSYHDVYGRIQLVKEHNQYMIPVHYPSMMENTRRNAPIRQDFSTLYADRDLTELRGQAEKIESYFAEITEISYSEPTFYSFTVPLKETKEIPINMDLEGITLKNLSISQVDETTYNMIFIAEKDQKFKQRYLYWGFYSETGKPLFHKPLTGYNNVSSLGVDLQEEFELQNVYITSDEVLPDTVNIQINNAQNRYMFEEGEKRVPLLKSD
jgi:hypothetical protein